MRFLAAVILAFSLALLQGQWAAASPHHHGSHAVSNSVEVNEVTPVDPLTPVGELAPVRENVGQVHSGRFDFALQIRRAGAIASQFASAPEIAVCASHSAHETDCCDTACHSGGVIALHDVLLPKFYRTAAAFIPLHSLMGVAPALLERPPRG
ncbi:MAG: hypothetical protein KDJ29_07915 [Hyphomicrobiales bacterium]|nr:hypothetical protein [Hyphomicrobiales bacterium]